MVIDQTRNIDLLVQNLILFLAVQLELVRFDDFHLEWFAVLL